MQITFWGVRGSYPVPGAATVRYGGQTSCVEARSSTGETLIVDAGTGMRALGNKLLREAKGPEHHHVLLSHVHWDHIQGLPFFSPAYIPGTRISIYALLTAADELQQVIGDFGPDGRPVPAPIITVPGSVTRNGSDTNPVGLVESAPALVGHAWRAAIELDGVSRSLLLVSLRGPTEGIFTPLGEVLIQPPLIRVLSGELAFPIPSDHRLIGLGFSAQAAVRTSGGWRLTNALDVTIGGAQ